MIHKGTLDYELLIDEQIDGQSSHGVRYNPTIEDNLAALMMACEILEEKKASLLEFKKTPGLTKRYRDVMGSQVNQMTQSLVGLNQICLDLLQGYNSFKSERKQEQLQNLTNLKENAGE